MTIYFDPAWLDSFPKERHTPALDKWRRKEALYLARLDRDILQAKISREINHGISEGHASETEGKEDHGGV